MKKPSLCFPAIGIAGATIALALLIGGCAAPRPPTPTTSSKAGTFASVRPVLERNCVHCHGLDRLTHMPSFTDTAALARLKRPGGWIVPGQPESSRIFQVVKLSDRDPGAMPPTGHALSKAETETLRAWIQAGAPLPEGAPVTLQPRGERPHSW